MNKDINKVADIRRKNQQKPHNITTSKALDWDGTTFCFSSIESTVDFSSVVTPAGLSKDLVSALIKTGIDVYKQSKKQQEKNNNDNKQSKKQQEKNNNDNKQNLPVFETSELCRNLKDAKAAEEPIFVTTMSEIKPEHEKYLHGTIRQYQNQLQNAALDLACKSMFIGSIVEVQCFVFHLLFKF